MTTLRPYQSEVVEAVEQIIPRTIARVLLVAPTGSGKTVIASEVIKRAVERYKRVLFLANHGVIVVGPDLATAFDDLYYLERAAQVQVTAAMTGGALKRVGDNLARETFMQMDKLRTHYAAMHFNALRKVLDREAPDYRR